MSYPIASANRSANPQAQAGLMGFRRTTLSINIQSALLDGESNLYSFVQTVSFTQQTQLMLHCWDDQSVDEQGIEQGARIFKGMRAKACEGLKSGNEAGRRDAHFALLLHISINLSHGMQLPEGKTQGEFNSIIDDRKLEFHEMQDNVFSFFGQTRTVLPKAVPVEQPSAPVYLPADPRFENLAEQVKELKLPAQRLQARQVKQAEVPPKAFAQRNERRIPSDTPASKIIRKRPKARLPSIQLPKLEVQRLEVPRSKVPRLKVPRFTLPSIDLSGSIKAVVAAQAKVTRALYQAGADALAAVRAFPRQLSDAMANSALTRKARFGAEVVRAGIERAASKVGHAAKAGADMVASGVKAAWNGARRLISSAYERY